MKEAQIVLTKSTVNRFLLALKNTPESYSVYTSYAESLYVVTDIVYDEDTVWITSRDNRDNAVPEMTVKKIRDLLNNMENCEDNTIKLAPAENIDPSVDLSMTDDYYIAGISKDDVCKSVYVFAY